MIKKVPEGFETGNNKGNDFRIFARETLPHKYGVFNLVHFTNEDSSDDKEAEYHHAVCMGEINDGNEVFVRVHSSCLTGEVFGFDACDCGEQLDEALRMISEKNRGVLLYLNQEGRGIGLANKMKAYELKSQGLDTVKRTWHWDYRRKQETILVLHK